MFRSTVIGLGTHRGSPRVFLSGAWLRKAGFEPGARYRTSFSKDRVVLEVSPSGACKVSAKQQNTVPVIDLNNRQLADAFSATQLEVRAYERRLEITPARTVLLITSRELTRTEGSLFSGGGLLTEAAASLGFEARFAVELNPEYAAIYERNHPTATMFNASVEQVAWEDLRKFAPLGLLTMGIPCEPFSHIRTLNRGGQEKRDKTLPPEAHELGDMVFWALRAVEATNPYGVIIENVPSFLDSGAYAILRAVLRRLGYHVESRVLAPTEVGGLTGRKRAVVIGHAGRQPVWPTPTVRVRRLREILDQEPHEWFDRSTKPWLYEHWERQAAKGNGFPSQIVSADSTSVGTIKKRYFAGQGDNPVLAHPEKHGTHRWFTLNEVKRLHGIKDSYDLGAAKTTAGEVIGQGVHVDLFRQIIDLNFAQCAKRSTA